MSDLASKLRTAAVLEAKARQESDRLMSIAFEQGMSDRQIAAATGLTFDCVRMRRRRRKQRRDQTRKRSPIPARPKAMA